MGGPAVHVLIGSLTTFYVQQGVSNAILLGSLPASYCWPTESEWYAFFFKLFSLVTSLLMMNRLSAHHFFCCQFIMSSWYYQQKVNASCFYYSSLWPPSHDELQLVSAPLFAINLWCPHAITNRLWVTIHFSSTSCVNPWSIACEWCCTFFSHTVSIS